MQNKRRKNKQFFLVLSIFGTLSFVTIYKYLLHEFNREGSNIWLKYNASLEDIKGFREKIRLEYCNAGINKLSFQASNRLQHELFYIDKIIEKIEHADFVEKHLNLKLPQRENGWYLPNND